MGFYGTNETTKSVKALNKDVQGIGFNLTRSTPPCDSNTTDMQYDKINTHANAQALTFKL